MTRRKRQSRAKNKLQGSLENALIKSEPAPVTQVPAIDLQTAAVAIRRSGLFNAELEWAIDLIARERVYRAMLARLRLSLLTTHTAINEDDLG